MTGPRSPSGWFAAGLALIFLAAEARALDPNHTLSQYLREQWTADTSFPGGAVDAITQTADGYLWLGTEKGLVRFDGVDFRLISSFPEFPGVPISGVTTDGNGRLCVIFWGAGVLCQRDGKFVNLATALGRTTLEVASSWREADGASLLTDLNDGVLRIRGEQLQVIAPQAALPPSLVLAIAEARDGKIWLGTPTGLFYFADGRTTRVSDIPDKKINCLLPVGDKELWIGTSKGLYRWNGTQFNRVNLPPALPTVEVVALLRDHDGNIWAGTTSGLFRINSFGASFLDDSEFGRRGIHALFEDREGNLWAGGGRGLERIRDGIFVTYTLASGSPPSKQDGPLYVDSENRTWFAPAGGGLYVIKDGRDPALVSSSLLHTEVIYSITGRNNEIWIGTQHSGLKRFEYRNGLIAGKTYTQANGLAEDSVFTVYPSRDGTVWAGTLTRGISKFEAGRFVTYTTADGLTSNTVSAILETRDGTMWFATPNGLSSLSRGHWKTYAREEGLPSSSVNCLFEDSSGALWVGTPRGLAFFKSGRLQVPRDPPDSLREEVFGISEDKEGWLWMVTSGHVLRVSSHKLSTGVLSSAEICEYGAADGLPNTTGVKGSKLVAADRGGRIWFALTRGLSVVDPSHLSSTSAPALPHVEAILADNDSIPVAEPVRVPSSRKRITFKYSGLSLAVPERVRFRYSLHGFDPGWSEPTAVREAVYTNLSPGSYRFRVIASNSYGQWNDSEAAISLEVDPAYWQTAWFRGLCVAAFLALLGALYQLRLRQVARQFKIRLDERVSERTRIARDLHDTILQTIQGSKLVVDDALEPSTDPVRMRRTMQQLSVWLASAMQEGREALNSLRASTTETNDLAEALRRATEDSVNPSSMEVKFSVVGAAREMHPLVRDEIYRIGYEAIHNACTHSGATRLEVKLKYSADLALLVSDNGTGIEPVIAAKGRDGHFGLQGMQERAARIHGKLTIASSSSSGTEIKLIVPGRSLFKQ